MKLILILFNFFWVKTALTQYIFGNICGKSLVTSSSNSKRDEVTLGQMPWIVKVRAIFDDGFEKPCSGMIFYDQWIMTSANCVENAVSVQVSVGRVDYSPTGFSAHEQTANVAKASIFTHPNHQPGSYDSDIAMLKLPTALSLDEYVQPGCTFNQQFCDRNSGDSLGLCSDLWVGSWDNADQLKRIAVSIANQTECQRGRSDSITKNHVCVASSDPQQFLCTGSSGGPLFCRRGDQVVTLGVATFPAGCGLLPGIYARTCPYLDWILQVFQPMQTSSNVVTKTTVQPRNCPSSLPFVANSRYAGGGVSVGSRRIFLCNDGYQLDGQSNSITCSSNGQWSPPTSSCIFIGM